MGSTYEQPFVETKDGRQVVAEAGTRVQLSATSIKIKKVEVTALTTNLNAVAVGSSTVVAAEGTERGKILYAQDSITIFSDNLNKVYIDSRANGEGVSFVYYQ